MPNTLKIYIRKLFIATAVVFVDFTYRNHNFKYTTTNIAVQMYAFQRCIISATNSAAYDRIKR